MTERTRLNGEKELYFRNIISTGASAWTYFVPSSPGVIVPASCRNQKVTVLQWGTKLIVPVRHFVISGEGVSGLLTFKGIWHACYIPWESVHFMQADNDPFGRDWTADHRQLERPEALRNVISMGDWKKRRMRLRPESM